MTHQMNNVYLYAWKEKSKGAKKLAKALGIKRIKHEGSTFSPYGKTIINWGASTSAYDLSYMAPFRVVNQFGKVRQVGNKALFFTGCKLAGTEGPRTPRWCGREGAETVTALWGADVVCRTVLTGHSGNGIIIVQKGEPLPDAPLYVEYVKKDSEYRIHFMRIQGNVEVIDVQRKIRDPDREPVDWKIRSHANGFIFVRGGVSPPQDVLDQSRLAFLCSGLDFGAVDVIFNAKKAQAYVLEINTAPGLEGQTVEKYAEGFKRMLGST